MMKKKEVVDCEINNKAKKTSTELIRLHENRQVHYQGYCKLKINRISQLFLVEPINENFADISGLFKWKFFKQKNILFVFADFDSQDFILVFKTEKICKKVYNGIFKNRVIDFVENDLLKERFLNSMFKNALQNSRLKEILEEWIQKCDEKEKNEYLKHLKLHQENPQIISDDEQNDVKSVKPEMLSLPKKNRKRRHHEIGFNGLSDSTVFVDQGTFNGCDNAAHESQLKLRKNFSTD